MTQYELSRLKAMADPNQQSWDLSPNDQSAIRSCIDALKESEQERERLQKLLDIKLRLV